MTDIRKKARVLLNAAREAHVNPDDYLIGQTAVCLAIEQHEAFKQKVSDIVYAHVHVTRTDDWEQLKTLIIPKPKPDPLVEALEGVKFDHYPPNDAKTIRAALDALGFEIREKGQ